MADKTFITHKQFDSQAKKAVSVIGLILGLLVLADISLLGLQFHFHSLSVFTKLAFVLTGFYLLLLGALIAFVGTLLRRLKNSGFGINSGDVFYDWIKARLEDNGITSVAKLNEIASQRPPGLRLRPGNPESIDKLDIDVTFIASELVTQNKIEFPRMYNLFRPANASNPVHPAGFIRASMSIPLFFESYYIDHIPGDSVRNAWQETFGEDHPPSKARFVDGGILSNFPINIFYNKEVVTPRLPSFGIDLDDTKKEEKDSDASEWSLPGFVGRMFNTIRFYYDKDFQIKNRVLKKGIGSIPLSQYNWLNFFLKDCDKINMFVLGAQAAAKFLKSFDWEDFKSQRTDMHLKITPSKK
jgi:NTE family protein